MTVLFASAEDAEDAFYEAIGRGDLEALMSVWADDDEIVCIHPTGERLCGPAAIGESWREIFANNPNITVRVSSRIVWRGVMLDVHSVVEMLYVGGTIPAHDPMQSTNIYQRGPNGWRLLARHTSAVSRENGADTRDETGPSHHTLH